MLVTQVLLVGSVLHVRTPVAVVAAPTELRVETLDVLGLDSSDLLLAQHRPNVLVNLPHVAGSGLAVDLDDLQVAVEELVDRGAGARAPSFVDPAEKTRPDLLGLLLGLPSGRASATVSRSQSFSPVSWSISA